MDTVEKTMRLIAAMKKSKIDPTLFFLLQVPDTIAHSDKVLKTLREFCSDFEILELSSAFYQEIENHIYREGIQEIDPMEFIYGFTKHEIYAEYKKKKEKWGIHKPFLVQYYTSSLSRCLYAVTRTWQDGIHRLLGALQTGVISHRSVPYAVCGAIEHPFDEETICYAMFDCERYVGEFKGHKSIEEIREIICRFPALIELRLVSSGAIYEESLVKFEFKDKSREIAQGNGKKDFKISYHFISSIIGTKKFHMEAINKAIEHDRGWMQMIKEKLDAKGDLLFLQEPEIQNPLISFDLTSLPGGPNGFITHFSRKEFYDVFPEYIGTETICCGSRYEWNKSPYFTPHDIFGEQVTKEQRLEMLRKMCYTIPKLYVTNYAQEFIDSVNTSKDESQRGFQCTREYIDASKVEDGESRVGTETFQSVPHPLVGEAADRLPKWFQLELGNVIGGKRVEIRTTLPMINKTWIPSLPTNIRESSFVAHVFPCWCANMMAKGELVLHKSNGTIVATHGDTVYLACPTGEHKIKINTTSVLNIVNQNSPLDEVSGEVIPIVPGEMIREKCIHWVMLNEYDMKTLKEKRAFTSSTPTTSVQEISGN